MVQYMYYSPITCHTVWNYDYAMDIEYSIGLEYNVHNYISHKSSTGRAQRWCHFLTAILSGNIVQIWIHTVGKDCHLMPTFITVICYKTIECL